MQTTLPYFLSRMLLLTLFVLPLRAAGTAVEGRALRDWPESPRVYLIRVDREIDPLQLITLRRGVEAARAARADALVLRMDTPGGRVDIMREIVSHLIDLEMPTYTLVESDAFSAGAIIALATDHVFMRPQTHIGDAMPILAGPQGLQSLGDAEREKIESGMDAIVRGIAQRKGRDEMLMRAMVRRELEYKMEDGTVISPKGQILTLTNQEAERLRPDGTPLLSEGTVADLDEMLERIGLGAAERIEETRGWADQVALWIVRISPLLLTLALGLFYLEMNSPGIGWMGGAAVLLFLVVTFGHNVAGLAGMEDLVLIVLGLVLLLVEVLFIPGFGFVGLSGIGLVLVGLVRAMTIRYPGHPGSLPGFSNFGNVAGAVSSLSFAVIGSAALFALFLRNLGANNLLGRRLVLGDAVATPGTSAALRELIGRPGLCLTPLNPSGTVRVEGRELDALSDGEYLDAGVPVRVDDVRNRRILVSRAS